MYRPIEESIKDVLEICHKSPSGLIWKVDVSSTGRAGSSAGCLANLNYYLVRYNKRLYKAHRIVWFLATGEDPGFAEIDHIDGNPSNNHIDNLRKATSSQQKQNKKGWGKYGYKCVQKYVNGKYRAYIVLNKKQKHLGYYATAEEAARAYDKAAIEYFGEFARLNFPEGHST